MTKSNKKTDAIQIYNQSKELIFSGSKNDLCGKDLRMGNFTKWDLSEFDFTDCTLSLAKFDNVKANHAIFDGAIFERCDLSNSDFTKSSFDDTYFSECNLSDSKFDEDSFSWAQFYECNLENSRFHSANLRHVGFFRCNIIGTEFHNTEFKGSRFCETDILKTTP